MCLCMHEQPCEICDEELVETITETVKCNIYSMGQQAEDSGADDADAV